MDYATFRKAHPATRCFERYSSETRATMASSFRLGRRQRQAVGEYFYIHPMVAGVAFMSAKAATTAAHAVYQEKSKALAVDVVMGGRGIEVAAVLGEGRAEELTSAKTEPMSSREGGRRFSR